MSATILKLLNAVKPAPKKSVDSVLTAFSAAIHDLDEVRAKSLADAHDKEQAAIVANAEARAAREEAARAAEVSSKLKSLIAA